MTFRQIAATVALLQCLLVPWARAAKVRPGKGKVPIGRSTPGSAISADIARTAGARMTNGRLELRGRGLKARATRRSGQHKMEKTGGILSKMLRRRVPPSQLVTVERDGAHVTVTMEEGDATRRRRYFIEGSEPRLLSTRRVGPDPRATATRTPREATHP